MKSPILPVSFPAEIRDEVVKLAMKKNISVSEFIRNAVFEKLSRETGNTYESLQWGGYRPNSGRKPSVPAIRSAAEKLSARSRLSPQKSRRRSAQ